MADIEEIKKEYDSVIEELSDPEVVSDWQKFEELSKKKKSLERLVEKFKEIEDIEKKIKENKAIISSQLDPELVILAEGELPHLEKRESELKKELENLLKEDSSASSYDAILEIRAGAGGDEASLFAANLYKMYARFAESKGWPHKVLESHPTELGGFKEIIFEINSEEAFSKLKYEGGVHRVQRIPETEKQGRIHTSTASVAVLPKPKKSEFKIKPDELKIDVYRSSGPGGQNVNKRETAVRITHVPTGMVVSSQTERNQAQNKENALAILSARLMEQEEEERTKKLGGKRNEQIGSAKRAEKIRTYNFPQDRITDHRVKKSWHNIEETMAGRLDELLNDVAEELKPNT